MWSCDECFNIRTHPYNQAHFPTFDHLQLPPFAHIRDLCVQRCAWVDVDMKPNRPIIFYPIQIIYRFLFLLFPRFLTEDEAFGDWAGPVSEDSSFPNRAEILIQSESQWRMVKVHHLPRFDVPTCHCTLHSGNFSMLFLKLWHCFGIHVILQVVIS